MEDRDRVLLGIKYEAAVVGGIEGEALTRIEAQVESEAGDGWRDDPLVLRGRNAVRAEHGLPGLGEPTPQPKIALTKPLWHRLLGR
jgi:hypothetical protein